MDKEFLEKVLACKTSDELKALLNSRMPLDDDDLDQVNGGMISFGKDVQTGEGLDLVCRAVQRIENAFGRDMAATWISKATGNHYTVQDYYDAGISGLRQRLGTRIR